jgi:hypothetical protein
VKSSAAAIEEQAMTADAPEPLAGQLAHTARELHADDMLEDAVRALSLSDDTGLPVLGVGSREVVGWSPTATSCAPTTVSVRGSRGLMRRCAVPSAA